MHTSYSRHTLGLKSAEMSKFSPIQLVVFDMSGTTVLDRNEVLNCFFEAAVEGGINTSVEQINSMMGWSKIEVFRTLVSASGLVAESRTEEMAQRLFQDFRSRLESYYRQNPVTPTTGTEELFRLLKQEGIFIALTTGFYREVTNILLEQLGWNEGLDEMYRGNEESLIDISITSDEVAAGRPHPDMIHKAMQLLHITDPSRVVCIGDTPSDLQAGRAAACGFVVGICSGSHTRSQLELVDHDLLVDSMPEFQLALES